MFYSTARTITGLGSDYCRCIRGKFFGVNDNIHITQIHLFCNHFRWLNFGIRQKTISGAGDLAQSSGRVRKTLSTKLCPQPRWNVFDNGLAVVIVTVMNNTIWNHKHFLHVKYCSKHFTCIE